MQYASVVCETQRKNTQWLHSLSKDLETDWPHRSHQIPIQTRVDSKSGCLGFCLSIAPTPVPPLFAPCPRRASAKRRRPSGRDYPRQGHEDAREEEAPSRETMEPLFYEAVERVIWIFWRQKPLDCVRLFDLAFHRLKGRGWWGRYDAVAIKSVRMKRTICTLFFLCRLFCVSVSAQVMCGVGVWWKQAANLNLNLRLAVAKCPFLCLSARLQCDVFRHFWYALWFSIVRLMYLILGCYVISLVFYIYST